MSYKWLINIWYIFFMFLIFSSFVLFNKFVAIIISVFMLVFAIAGGYFIINVFFKHMQKLNGKIKNTNEEKLELYIDDCNIKEIKVLINSYNCMAEKLKKSITEKDEILSYVCHELKTPLSIILMNCDSLNEDISNDCIDTIKKQTLYMSVFIKKMLDDMKFCNESEVIFEKADLSQIAEDICEEQYEISDRDIDFRFKIQKGIIVEIDIMLMARLIQNLLSNAYKYTNDGGNIYAELKSNSDNIIFYVKDNGIGIATDEQGDIWKRFYRASNAKGIYDNKSTGLGLSIVKKIAELHGGIITVESQIGMGSIFTLILKKKSIRVSR